VFKSILRPAAMKYCTSRDHIQKIKCEKKESTMDS